MLFFPGGPRNWSAPQRESGMPAVTFGETITTYDLCGPIGKRLNDLSPTAESRPCIYPLCKQRQAPSCSLVCVYPLRKPRYFSRSRRNFRDSMVFVEWELSSAAFFVFGRCVTPCFMSRQIKSRIWSESLIRDYFFYICWIRMTNRE